MKKVIIIKDTNNPTISNGSLDNLKEETKIVDFNELKYQKNCKIIVLDDNGNVLNNTPLCINEHFTWERLIEYGFDIENYDFDKLLYHGGLETLKVFTENGLSIDKQQEVLADMLTQPEYYINSKESIPKIQSIIKYLLNNNIEDDEFYHKLFNNNFKLLPNEDFLDILESKKEDIHFTDEYIDFVIEKVKTIRKIIKEVNEEEEINKHIFDFVNLENFNYPEFSEEKHTLSFKDYLNVHFPNDIKNNINWVKQYTIYRINRYFDIINNYAKEIEKNPFGTEVKASILVRSKEILNKSYNF